MHPGRDIQRQNLIREMNRRLAFVKKRMLEVMIEFHFIQGRIIELPYPLRMPPDWVLDAARLSWETGFGNAFKNLTKEEIKRDPRGALRELIAVYEAMVAYVGNPRTDPKLPPEANAAGVKLHKFAQKIVAKNMLTQLRKLDSTLEELLPPSTTKQLHDYSTRYDRGLRATVDSSGELFADTSRTSQIYYLVWFFYPYLIKKPALSAAVLTKWLGDEVGFFVSQKSVERVHTKLKLASRFQSKARAT